MGEAMLKETCRKKQKHIFAVHDSGKCEQRRHRRGCATAQSRLSLRRSHIKTGRDVLEGAGQIFSYLALHYTSLVEWFVS